MASVSSDSTAAVPRTSYTKSINFCSLRKTKGFVSELLQLMFSVDCVQSEICAAGLARGCTHLTLIEICLPFLLGLVLAYPKVYQEMPELCHILWGDISGHSTNLFRFSYISQVLPYARTHELGLALAFGGILESPWVSGSSTCRIRAYSKITLGRTISSFQFPPSRGLLSSEVLFRFS